MSWDFNLNSVLLIAVFLMQCWKIWLHVQTKRLIRSQDKVVRENLQVQTNYNAIVASLVESYHHLTIGTAKDAKETMTVLAGEVKDVVAAGVQASTDVAAKLAADSTVLKRGEVQ